MVIDCDYRMVMIIEFLARMVQDNVQVLQTPDSDQAPIVLDNLDSRVCCDLLADLVKQVQVSEYPDDQVILELV